MRNLLLGLGLAVVGAQAAPSRNLDAVGQDLERREAGVRTIYTTVNTVVTLSACPANPTTSAWATAPAPSTHPSGSGVTGSALNGSSFGGWNHGATDTPTPTMAPPSSSSLMASAAYSCSLLPTTPITNWEQVGNSTLGTLCQPYSPQWLGDSKSAPWGDNRTVYNSDVTVKSDVPVTNVTRYYDFTVSRGQISADGVLRDVILVNNQFPGPTIEANWGDWIQVRVHNNITDPFEGTSMHWHGMLQKGTQWMDGVPGASQCPIAPGHNLTYYFQAEEFGTSWYHAHYSAQLSAGVQGAMVIHGPSSLPYDVDIGPVMLSDWYHIPYFSIVENVVGTNFSLVPPVSDSVLINGRGQWDCSQPSYDSSADWLSSNLRSNLTWTCVDNAPISSFRFQSNKVHRLRVMNTGANGIQKFTIDHHNLTVIAVDFVPIVPYNTSILTLGVGQRADVLVLGSDTPKASVYMRATAPSRESCGGAKQSQTVASIYYEQADTTVAPDSVSDVVIDETTCVPPPLADLVPAYAITPRAATFTQDLNLSLAVNSTGHFEFQINGQAWRVDYNTPLLAQIASGNATFAPQWNVYDFQENASVILNLTNNMPLTHPFHLHGHDFYVLDAGTAATSGLSRRQGGPPAGAGAAGAAPSFGPGATWDGRVLRPDNPTRRDTVLIPPMGFAAVQFELNNPGVWPFHCHVAWHLSGGQGIDITYGTGGFPQPPEGWEARTCKGWDEYSSQRGPVDQIDAGVKM